MFSFCVKNPKDIWTAYTQFTVRSVHTEAAAAAATAAAAAAAMLGHKLQAVAVAAMLGQQAVAMLGQQ